MATKKMTQAVLRGWIVNEPMTHYNTKTEEPTADSVIGDHITDPAAQKIVKDGMKLFLVLAKVVMPKKFPKDWLTMTAKELAKVIIPMLLLFMSLGASAQPSPNGGLTIDLGTFKTADKNTAVSVGITYLRSIDSIWQSKDMFFTGKHSIFSFNPQFDVRFGSQDAFNSIQGKLVGTFMSFKMKDYEGFSSPDFSKTVNVFPVAIGVEANTAFTSYNGILEAGYTPYFKSNSNSLILKHVDLSVFLQGGYKFKGDSAATIATGGAKDESSEIVKSSILRLKGSLAVDTKGIVKTQGVNFGLTGRADVWYDVIHSRVYHKIDAIGRFYLANGDTYIDFIYSKGAGAPTFNEASQYGAGIKFTL